MWYQLPKARRLVLVAVILPLALAARPTSMDDQRNPANSEIGRRLQGVQCHEDRCGIYCGPPRPPPCGNYDPYPGRDNYDDDRDSSDDRYDYKSDDRNYDYKHSDGHDYKSGDRSGRYQIGNKADLYTDEPGYSGPAYKAATSQEYREYAPAASSQDYGRYDAGGSPAGGYKADDPYEKHIAYSDSRDDNSEDSSDQHYPPENSDDSEDDSDDSGDHSDDDNSDDDSDDHQSDDDYSEAGCYGSLPFGLENCVCDGAEIGGVAGTAACGRVFTECEGMAPFHVEDGQVGAIQRTCDTLALDSCIGSARNALVENPGCAELLRFGTRKCTPGQASKIFEKSVKKQCKPLCKACVRHKPYSKNA